MEVALMRDERSPSPEMLELMEDFRTLMDWQYRQWAEEDA